MSDIFVDPKFFSTLNYVGHKFCWTKTYFLSQIIFNRNCFWPNIFFFWLNILLDLHFFLSKMFLDQKVFLTQNFLLTQNCSLPKILCTQNVLELKFFWTLNGFENGVWLWPNLYTRKISLYFFSSENSKQWASFRGCLFFPSYLAWEPLSYSALSDNNNPQSLHLKDSTLVLCGLRVWGCGCGGVVLISWPQIY